MVVLVEQSSVQAANVSVICKKYDRLLGFKDTAPPKKRIKDQDPVKIIFKV